MSAGCTAGAGRTCGGGAGRCGANGIHDFLHMGGDVAEISAPGDE